MNDLAPRDNRWLNSVGMGDSDEGLDVICAYVNGVLMTEVEWRAKLPDGDLFRRCPDCDGSGSISVMDGQGRETEFQCERCYRGGGYVKWVSDAEAYFFLSGTGLEGEQP